MIASRNFVMAAVVSSCVVLSAQQQPVFRAGVQVVEVDARVFDANGRFVTTLTRDDFDVIEDGVPQTIVALSLIDTARTSSTSTPSTVPPTPAGVHAPTPPPRQTWIFFFDLNHLTPGDGFDRAKEAVRTFITEQLPDGDMAGILAGGKMINNRLSSNRAEMLSALSAVRPLGEARVRMIELTREWPPLRDDEEALRIARDEREAVQHAAQRACSADPSSCTFADQAVREKARRLSTNIQVSTRETYQAINGLASGLARVPGPKTVVFLSDGFTTFGMENALRTLVGQAGRAGARIYAIDVRGLSRVNRPGFLDAPTYDDAAGAGTVFDAFADGVNSLAVDTGGLMIRNENNIGRALDMVAADAVTYYVIGYQPTNTAFDGTYRKIQIRVKRPDVSVRARQGYLALDPSKMLVPERIR